MEERDIIEISIFIAEALATNRKAYKNIDRIYEKNKELYLNIQHKNKEWDNYKIVTEGTFEHEYYFKKILAMIEYLKKSHNEDVASDITFIISEAYKPAKNYLTSRNNLNFTQYCSYLHNKFKDISDDEFNGNLIAVIMLANDKGIEINTDDDMFNRYIFTLKSRLDRYKEVGHLDIKNLGKDEQKLIQKVMLKLKKDYRLECSNSMYKTTPDKFYETANTLNNELLDSIDKFLIPFEYMEDIEGVSLTSLTSNIKVTDYDIKNNILTYLYINRADNVEEIDFDELYRYIVCANSLMCLIREYKRTKSYISSTYTKDYQDIIEKKDEEINRLSKTNNSIESENRKLKEEIELLKRKNEALQNEVNSFASSKMELSELRNYIFNNRNNDEQYEMNTIDVRNLNAIAFSGSPRWIAKMKQTTTWDFVHTDTLNFDAKIFESVDYVIIHATTISHAMYYKVIANLRDHNKIKYINDFNIDKCLNALQ